MTKKIILLRMLQFFCILSVVSSFSLEGKRALITGGSGGIGAGIAKKLASEGAEVLIHYNERKEMAIETARTIGSNNCVGIVQCDFRNPESIKRLFRDVIGKEIWKDGFDILINNAGIVTKLATMDDDEDLSAWHETMSVNLHAPMQLSRLAQSHLIKKRDDNADNKNDGDDNGVIVNVSSIHGDRSVENMVAYAASKAALDAITRGLALEFASDKIRVNAIAPGVVPVERTAKVFANPDVVDMWLPHLPVSKLGTIDAVADSVLPLITNEWMTGTILTIDGGMMARSNMPFRPKPPKPASTGETLRNGNDDVTFEKLENFM